MAARLVAEFDERAGSPDPYRQAWQWLDQASNAVANIDGAGLVVRHQLPVDRLSQRALVYLAAAESLLVRLAAERAAFAASMGDAR